MLTLTRPQRQTLATLVIVALTVVPTALVVAKAWWIHQPGHVREVEATLSQSLGLAVEIAAVRHPSPREDLLDGLVLRIEEPGGHSPTLSEVLRADSARIVRRSGRCSIELTGLRLLGDDPTAALARLQTLTRHLGRISPRADLVAATGQVELGRGSRRATFPFRDLAANVQVTGADEQVSCSFRLDGEEESPRCELQLETTAESGESTLVLTLQTMDGPIPSTVFNPLFDASAWLGDSAQVRGTLRIERRADQPFSARFEGELTDVELASLVQNHFPDQRLSGRARLSIRSAIWDLLPGAQTSGWRSVEGRLSAGSGRIGGGFLRALGEEMRFSVEPESLTQANSSNLTFQSLGLDFSLRESGEILVQGAARSRCPSRRGARADESPAPSGLCSRRRGQREGAMEDPRARLRRRPRAGDGSVPGPPLPALAPLGRRNLDPAGQLRIAARLIRVLHS